MKIAAALIALLAATAPVAAAEKLTLNDIPAVLEKLRSCTSQIFRETCVGRKSWIAVDDDGVVIFYKTDSLELTGRGRSLDEALGSLATSANKNTAATKRLLDAIGPLLPTQ